MYHFLNIYLFINWKNYLIWFTHIPRRLWLITYLSTENLMLMKKNKTLPWGGRNKYTRWKTFEMIWGKVKIAHGMWYKIRICNKYGVTNAYIFNFSRQFLHFLSPSTKAERSRTNFPAKPSNMVSFYFLFFNFLSQISLLSEFTNFPFYSLSPVVFAVEIVGFLGSVLGYACGRWMC